MSNFQHIPSRALDLISQIGSGIGKHVPDRAMNWIETGAALGALRTGQRYATRLVRRNPAAVAVAAAAGVGLLWYAARRRARQAEDDTIEGSATRIEATPVQPRRAAASRPRKKAARSRARTTA